MTSSGLLWHSTAADGLLQGGDSTVPTSKTTEVGTVLSPPCSNPSAAVLCYDNVLLPDKWTSSRIIV